MFRFRQSAKPKTPQASSTCRILEYSSPLDESVKSQLTAALAITLSFQVRHDSSESYEIARDLLTFISAKMNVSPEIVEAYVPLLAAGMDQSIESRLDSIMHFISYNNFTYVQKLDIVIRIILTLVLSGIYNATSREFVRLLCRSLSICRDDYVSMESIVAHYIEIHKAEIDKVIVKSKETGKSKMIRYAKIGAMSLGAGAVIAVTGGIAAPAIAGALFLMGGSALAATASVVSMATIFGTAGAGLTGYKMMKRTRGLTEFEFEQYGKRDKLAVCILVSGWMNDVNDYRRSFGVIGKEISPNERLMRFYRLNAPERTSKVVKELEDFKDDLNSLYDEIFAYCDKDPRDEENLIETKALHCNFISNIHDIIFSAVSSLGSNDGDVNLDAILSGDAHDIDEVDVIQSNPSNMNGIVVGALSDCNKKKVEENIDEDIPIWDINSLPEFQAFDMYLLRWETQLQLELGSSIRTLLKNLASNAVQNVLAATVFTTLAAAVMWPAVLIKFTDVIDNLWAIAIERAELAGIELANAILSGQHGSRPITLIGYSFGSRVIFSCLKEICRRLDNIEIPEDEDFYTSTSNANEDEEAIEKKQQQGAKFIIHDLILLGTPVNCNSKWWRHIRNIVSGRVINGYSQNDLILGIMYRYQRFQYSVSGITEVKVEGVENIDLSALVSKHTDYCINMKQILEKIDICNPIH